MNFIYAEHNVLHLRLRTMTRGVDLNSELGTIDSESYFFLKSDESISSRESIKNNVRMVFCECHMLSLAPFEQL